MKLSFSLNKAKPKQPDQAPPIKRPTAFASVDDEDDHTDAAPTTSIDYRAAANKKLLAQNVDTSKATKKRMEAEKRVDSTVYEYDEVYDKMQEAKERQKVAKELDSRERKVCKSTNSSRASNDCSCSRNISMD
jgi:coiled-coil domain-containing protein 55